MSKFSIYLEEIIRRSGEPISRIAKNAGLERTSIHKALKDERILSYSALKKLTQYFQLTISESRELNLYYDILLQGEEVYSTHSEICQLLFDLKHLHFSAFQYNPQSLADIKFSSKIVQGKSETEYTIQTILHRETEISGSVINLYSGNNNPLAETLIKLWRSGRDFTVNQIVSFRQNTTTKNHNQQNIHLIRNLLPVSLLSGSRYFAFYCFINDEIQESLNPFPYFIVTTNFMISINIDFSIAYINTDSSLIRFYHKQFEQTKAECQPLISYSNEPLDVLSSYMNNTDKSGYFTIMTQPCMGRYYTRNIIEKYIRQELPYRRELIEMGVRRFSVLAEQTNNYYTVFTEEGIKQFIADGIIADLPSAQVLPLEPSDRLILLKQLREDIAADHVNGYIANEDQFAIPQYLTFTCDPHFGLHVYAINDFVGGSYTCNLHISAVNIGKVFCDFIHFLPNTKYMYSKDQTLSILDSHIFSLESKLSTL